MSVLDPSLRALLEHERELDRTRPHGDAPSVGISVSFTGDIADLHHLGFRAPSVIDGPRSAIAAGSIPLDRLEQLAAIDHVISVEASRPLRAELNFSIPEIDAGATKFPANQFTGRNIVVGIVDVGVDYRHGVFRKPDKTTRIRTRAPIARPDDSDRGPQQFSTLPAFAALRGQALTTPTGHLYAALISRYFSEIRGLIRSNRRVGAVWQRIGGPSLVRQLMQRVFDPDRPLPSTIKDASLASGVGRFLEVLRRHGSPDLCRDIDRFGGMMTALEGRSLNGLLGRQP